MFRGHQTEIGHQLAGIVEAAQISGLGDQGDGDDQGDATHGLQGLDHGRHGPTREQLLDLPGQSIAPGLGVLDGMDGVLQHDLSGRMLETDRRQPASVRQRPIPAMADMPVAEQKPGQLLARPAQGTHRGGPGTDQIARRAS